MAQGQLAEMVGVGLDLQEADPRVELGGDGHVLVLGGQDPDKGAVVRADVRDVAVAAGAERGVPVAASWGLHGRAAGEFREEGNGGEQRVQEQVGAAEGEEEEIEEREEPDGGFADADGGREVDLPWFAFWPGC